jgi:choline dehydrogenase
MTQFQRHFIDAAVAAGLSRVEDFNAPKNTTGAGPAPRNVVNGVRHSMALTHLAAARTRGNLEVRAGVLVDKILISSRTVTGVRLADGTEIRSPEVVLCAGAYESPAILMRSGIGPATELTRHGIGVVADLPVGSALTEHPFFTMLISADPAKLGATLPAFGVTVTARSAGSVEPDLHILPSTFVAPDVTPTGAAFAVQVGMVQPTSRGRVRLRSRSPNERPQVTPALLRTDDDLDRTLQGIAIARNILAEAPLSDLIVDHLDPPAEMVGDELTARLRERVGSYCHPVATAAMGPQGGTHSVVDGHGRVWGLDGIYLADASIIPVIPSVAINITVAMVAERISSWIAEAAGPLRAAG